MSLKRELLDNPPDTEQIFFNKDRYESSRVYSVDWSEITEYYNLDTLTFAYKVASPFAYPTNPTVFKLYRDGTEYDAARDERLISGDTHVVYKVEYPNEFTIKGSVLLIIPSYEWDRMDDVQREHYVTINCYVNLVHKKCVHRTWSQIEKSEKLVGYDLNWVWFRKPGDGKKMSSSSALTWLEHNPDLNCVLWTDIEDENELAEAFDPPIPTDKVTVKYKKDTLDFIRDDVPSSFYELVENRIYDRVLIAKTDYVRTLVLNKNGGFYADFNDCVCFCPVRYWFHEVPNRELVLPCDTFNAGQISNYFVFVKKGSRRFNDLHREKFKNFPTLKRYLMDSDVPEKIAKLYLGWALKFLSGTRGRPVKELAKLMVPDNGVFNMKLKEAIGQEGFKGFKMSDIRARVFFPMYVFKYLRDRDEEIRDFYEFMSSEFLEILNIDQSAKIRFTSNDHDDSYDTSGLKKFEGLVKSLENDETFHKYMYTLFVRNMVGVLTQMTNFAYGLKMPMRDLVPFGYFLTGASMIGHYGHGTSLGVFDKEPV